ncbi:MAG TPA: thermonuclease family protein [Nitrospiraceae bacterium]|nr:thermonuclease family protein [Nitrospiraceae bacterium]
MHKPLKSHKKCVRARRSSWGTLGDVFLLDGTNVNQELVKQGWWWWYRKYAPLDTELERLEKDARETKKGLWADPQPVLPWEWRKRK